MIMGRFFARGGWDYRQLYMDKKIVYENDLDLLIIFPDKIKTANEG